MMSDEKCVLCEFAEDAYGIFWFPDGCYCLEDQWQPLCIYHANRSWSPRYRMEHFLYWGA